MTQEGKAVVITFGLILAALLGWLWWSHQQTAKVEGAIQAAVDACFAGHQGEYARRLVDARAAIRTSRNPIELGARLDNQLRMVGCKE